MTKKISSSEEHSHLFQDFILKVTATFLTLTTISELPHYARLRVKKYHFLSKESQLREREEVKYVTKEFSCANLHCHE